MVDPEQESPTVALARFFEPWEGDYELALHCGGDEDDDHMVPMKMVWDAATSHGKCPVCGNIAWLGNREAKDGE